MRLSGCITSCWNDSCTSCDAMHSRVAVSAPKARNTASRIGGDIGYLGKVQVSNLVARTHR
jgi:hypothetical protein